MGLMCVQSGLLKVVVPPDILDDGENAFGMVDGISGNLPQEGGAVRLQCLATGNPEPLVSWRRVNSTIILRNEGGRDKMGEFFL